MRNRTKLWFARSIQPRFVGWGRGDGMSQSDSTGEGSVSLSREDALEVARLLRLLTKNKNTATSLIRETHRLKATERERHVCNSHQLTAMARQIYIRRRARDIHFSPTLFGEPAWDMLLALYAAPDDEQNVSGLIHFSACPQTTALRYLSVLEDEDLIVRKAHPSDRRVSRISLTSKGRASLEAYLATVLDTEG